MSKEIEEIKCYFKNYVDRQPNDDSLIKKVEQRLGFKLPGILHEIYSSINGVCDQHDINYIMPLIGEEEDDIALVQYNEFWTPDGDAIPDWINKFVTFGELSSQESIAISKDGSNKLITYYLTDNDEYVNCEKSLSQLIIQDSKAMNDL